MPQQAARVGVFGGQAAVHFLQLADVVKQGRRQQSLAVQFGVVVGHAQAQPGHRQHMFKQAAYIGVVHAFGRRSRQQAGADGFVAQHGQGEGAPGLVGELGPAQGFGFGQLGRRPGAGGLEVGQVQSVALRVRQRAQIFHRHLRLFPKQADAAADLHKLPGCEVAELGAERTPYFGFQTARGVSAAPAASRGRCGTAGARPPL